MNVLKSIFILACMAAPLAADDIILKDGKKITFTVLRDLGDSVEAETPDGVKVEIKKSEILKVELKAKTAADADAKKEEMNVLLTGATFTWEKGRKLQQFDLFKSIDVKRDAANGSWKVAGGAITHEPRSDVEGFSRIETSYIPPEEYDLTVVLERMEGGDGFVVGLVGGAEEKYQTSFCFDRTGWSGAYLVDKKRPPESGVGVKEQPFKKIGEKRTVQFMVRKIGFAVKIDGKDFMAWTGDWSKMHPLWKADKKNVIFFAAGFHRFKLYSAVVTFPKEENK